MQADLLTLIDISNHCNSVSQTCRRRWRTKIEGASNIYILILYRPIAERRRAPPTKMARRGYLNDAVT